MINKLTKLNLATIATFILFTLLMLYRLGDSMFNADAHFWYTRTQGFIKAVEQRNWAQTYQNPKPGVTVMWLSGISLETFLSLYQAKYHFRPQIYTFDTFPYVETAVKLPLVILAILAIYTFYVLIKKQLASKTAFLILIILAFQPYFIGVLRYFHGDGTLTVFMMLAFIFTLEFVESKKLKWLIFSAISSGLAFLTKMQGFYLFAFVPFVLLTQTFLNKTSFMQLIKTVALWFVICFATIFIVFPALWVNPYETLNSMFNEAQIVTEEGKNDGNGSFMVYVNSIPKMFTTFSLFFFFVGLGTLIATTTNKQKEKPQKIYNYASLFIFFYLIQMALVFQKSERYLLPLFPMVPIISAYGLEYIINKFKLNFEAVALIVTVALFINTASYAPHYTAMAEEAPWGSLYSEAAKYLNTKPNAENLKVVAIPKEQTFRPFFKGKTYSKQEVLPNGWTPDYVVAAIPKDIPEKYSYCKYEHNIPFKNKIFWNIYKCK